MTLEAFLKQNAVSVDNRKCVVSERFAVDGIAVNWEYRAITSAEDEEIRKVCLKKGGDFDVDKCLGLLMAECTVFPDLKDMSLQDSYGVMGEDTLLKTMLTPGEYASYLEKIQEINGFEADMKDLVATAKN